MNKEFILIFICPFKYLILLELISDEKAIVEEIKHYIGILVHDIRQSIKKMRGYTHFRLLAQ